MTLFEWLPILYFGATALAAHRHATRRGWLYVAGAILLVIVARFAAPWPVRVWLPHVYLALGYWIPAAFTSGINTTFESWLARADERLGYSTPRDQDRGASHLFELAYLLCYPLVPVAFAVVFSRGNSQDIVRFWVAVLVAGYTCYVSLPWTAARPPRAIALDEHTRRGVARLNAHVLGRLSHNMNTFPSGHVAVSLAAALAVWPISHEWASVVGGMAGAIAVAAVVGRYHYLVDVLAGIVVGATASLVTTTGYFSV